jgi:hypothetical protein
VLLPSSLYCNGNVKGKLIKYAINCVNTFRAYQHLLPCYDAFGDACAVKAMGVILTASKY